MTHEELMLLKTEAVLVASASSGGRPDAVAVQQRRRGKISWLCVILALALDTDGEYLLDPTLLTTCCRDPACDNPDCLRWHEAKSKIALALREFLEVSP